MGTYGTAIMSDDTAADVAAQFKDSIAFGKTIEEAEDQLIADFSIDEEDDPYELSPFWLGLAAKQVKMGRLSDRAKSNALRIIDEGIDIAIWQEENPKLVTKRQAALDKLREQITGPQKKPTKVRKPFIDTIEWEEGDGLAYQLPSGKWTALHVLKIRRNPRVQTAFYIVLDIQQKETPTEPEVLSANIRFSEHALYFVNSNYTELADRMKAFDWRNKPDQVNRTQPTLIPSQDLGLYNHSGFWKCRRSSRDNPPRPFHKVTSALPTLPHDLLGVYYPYDWSRLDSLLQDHYGLD